MSTRTRVLALACAALAVAIVFGTAASALAAPGEPTLGLSALQTLLSNSTSGTVEGYFKTVVKGDTITTIPVTIQSITSGYRSGTSLIVFEATGPLMAKYGGIVAGMSGSPIYVHDGGQDKIVGAVSYGDYFTLSGAGLATPIESMIDLEDSYGTATSVMPLRRSVVSSGRVINRVIVSDNPQNFASAASDGAFVAKPLSSVFIGGLSQSGRAYKILAASLAKHGATVVTLGAAAGGSSNASAVSSTTPLVSGASVASLASRGDMWVGGIGTVTYANNGNVLAYGHSAYWEGDTSLYMSNAWIDYTWGSSYDPYKVGRPTALRGQFTQDRFAGIFGKVDSFASEIPVTAHAVDTDTGKSADSSVFIPRKLINSGKWDSEIVASAASVVSEKLEDVDPYYLNGSATTTTTVKVSDGTKEYQITIPNVYDCTDGDLGWYVTEDIYNIIDELQYYVLANGTQTLDVESVDLQMSYSQHHRSAQIAGVKTEGALKTGDNTATVTYVAYDSPGYVTREMTFTIPAGMPLSGTLSAACTDGYYYSDYYDDDYYDYSDSSEDTTPGPISSWIESVSDAATFLNSTQPYNAVALSYQPYATSSSIVLAEATSTALTPWYLSGDAGVSSPVISTSLISSTIDYRGAVLVMGDVDGPSQDSTVTIYGQVAGESSERLLKTVRAKYSTSDESASFKATIYGLPATTKLRFHIDQRDGWLSADTTRTLKVRAYAHLSASDTAFKAGKTIKLSASVLPKASAGAKVSFQYWSPSWGEWRTLSTKTLVSSGSAATASTTWKPSKGTRKVRVKYLGGTASAASTSNQVTLHVK